MCEGGSTQFLRLLVDLVCSSSSADFSCLRCSSWARWRLQYETTFRMWALSSSVYFSVSCLLGILFFASMDRQCCLAVILEATYLVGIPLEDVDNLSAGVMSYALAGTVRFGESGTLGPFSLEERLEFLLFSTFIGRRGKGRENTSAVMLTISVRSVPTRSGGG